MWVKKKKADLGQKKSKYAKWSFFNLSNIVDCPELEVQGVDC